MESGGRQYFQARPNALHEFGWFCAHLGRAGVLLMLQGNDVALPSDLGGVVELRFANDVSERYGELRKALVALELIE